MLLDSGFSNLASNISQAATSRNKYLDSKLIVSDEKTTPLNEIFKSVMEKIGNANKERSPQTSALRTRINNLKEMKIHIDLIFHNHHKHTHDWTHFYRILTNKEYRNYLRNVRTERRNLVSTINKSVKQYEQTLEMEKIKEEIQKRQNLINETVPEELSDITIKVGNFSFKAHSAILAAKSETFRNMFTYTEKPDNPEPLDLTEAPISPECFSAILQYIYLEEIEDFDFHKLGEFLYAVHYFDLEGFEDFLDKIMVELIKTSPSEENLIVSIDLCYKYKLPDLFNTIFNDDKLLNQLKKSRRLKKEHPEFKHLIYVTNKLATPASYYGSGTLIKAGRAIPFLSQYLKLGGQINNLFTDSGCFTKWINRQNNYLEGKKVLKKIASYILEINDPATALAFITYVKTHIKFFDSRYDFGSYPYKDFKRDNKQLFDEIEELAKKFNKEKAKPPLEKNFSPIFEDKSLADFTLNTSDKQQIRCNKVVLTTKLNGFFEMFSNEPKKNELNVELSEKSLKKLLEFIYKGGLKEIDIPEAKEILAFIHGDYSLKDEDKTKLKNIISNILIKKVDVENVLKCHALARSFGLTPLLNECGVALPSFLLSGAKLKGSEDEFESVTKLDFSTSDINDKQLMEFVKKFPKLQEIDLRSTDTNKLTLQGCLEALKTHKSPLHILFNDSNYQPWLDKYGKVEGFTLTEILNLNNYAFCDLNLWLVLKIFEKSDPSQILPENMLSKHPQVRLSIAMLQTLAESLPDLPKLNLEGNDNITHHLNVIIQFKKLRYLSLKKCSSLTALDIVQTLKQLLNLKKVNLSGTNISDDDLFDIAGNCPKLKEINVHGCPHITKEGIERCLKERPAAANRFKGLRIIQ